jgi:parallel beta-helix repeat protein
MYGCFDVHPGKQHMDKRIVALLISLVFFPIMVNVTVTGEQLKTGNNETIYVDDNNTEGPWNGTQDHPYQHIQDAIDDASGGELIYVFSGMYQENVIVDKLLTLTGENRSITIIDGMYEDAVIQIINGGTTILNFTIKNSGGYKDNAGIKVDADNVSITACTIYRTKTGIYVNNTSNNTITNCVFHTNGEGIFLKSSSANEIRECCFYHNAIGVHLQQSEKNHIHHCCAHTNGIGIYGSDSVDAVIEYCIFKNNNDNQGGVFLKNCSHIIIDDCVIRHNGVGVKTAYSSDITIERCSLLLNTHNAVKIRDGSMNITIRNCDIANNFRHGIRSQESECKITDNNFYNNQLYGLYTKSSYCNARYNWWGSPLGPALFTTLRRGERITRDVGKVLFFPWYVQPLCRACWEPTDPCPPIELPDDVHLPIKLPGNDTDCDGCPDWWEDKWDYNLTIPDDHEHLDPDGDALTNIEECYTDQWGSSPFHKDLFLELDWIESQFPEVTNKPPLDQIELMKTAFANHNIALHVDEGCLGGGEEIQYLGKLSYAMIRDIYWDYFLHNDLNNPRKGIFHYGIISDYGPGGGFAVVGWDHLDSFTISAQSLSEGFPSYRRGQLITTGSMHETGHTLGLLVDDFKGNDNFATTHPKYKEFWLYGNYKSCMSYRYTWDIMDYSDGMHWGRDFDDWGNLDFSFFKNTHFEWPKEEA